MASFTTTGKESYVTLQQQESLEAARAPNTAKATNPEVTNLNNQELAKSPNLKILKILVVTFIIIVTLCVVGVVAFIAVEGNNPGCTNGNEKTTMYISGRLVEVRCEEGGDMNGTWTLIQRRGQYGNAQHMFYETWSHYEEGFGSLDDEFWLGLKNIADITKEGQWQLQVDLTDWDENKYFAQYGAFHVFPAPNYELRVEAFDDKSTLGDSLKYHNRKSFSTRDMDKDGAKGLSCAVIHKGGWWYDSCHHSNLNGLNLAQQESNNKGIAWWNGKKRGKNWKTWKNSVIKIRRLNI